jgi:uncharacterized protein with PIN domain
MTAHYPENQWRRCRSCMNYYVPGTQHTGQKAQPQYLPGKFGSRVQYEECPSCKGRIHDLSRRPAAAVVTQNVREDMEALD